MTIGIVEGITAVAAAAKALEGMNKGGANEEAAEAPQVQEEAVDPRQDSQLVKDNKAFSPNSGASISGQLRFQTGAIDVGIGFNVNLSKQSGQPNAPIGIQALNEKDEPEMEGSLAQTEQEKDNQGDFSKDKWALVQKKRPECIEAANSRLRIGAANSLPRIEAPPAAKEQEKQIGK